MMKRVAALLFIALAVFAVVYSLQLRMYTSSGPGAGLFPLITGIMLGVLSLIWLVQDILQPAGQPAQSIPLHQLGLVGLQLLALIAFAVLLKPAGYLISAGIVTVATALIAGERNWFWIAVVVILATFGVSYLFNALGTTV